MYTRVFQRLSSSFRPSGARGKGGALVESERAVLARRNTNTAKARGFYVTDAPVPPPSTPSTFSSRMYVCYDT